MSSDAYLGGDEATQLVRDVPNEYYDLLSNSRRLRLLYVLDTATEPLSTTALATELAQREGTDPRSVELSLVHAHLPKLADHGIVEYDRDGVVLLDETPVPPSGLLSLSLNRTRSTNGFSRFSSIQYD